MLRIQTNYETGELEKLFQNKITLINDAAHRFQLSGKSEAQYIFFL